MHVSVQFLDCARETAVEKKIFPNGPALAVRKDTVCKNMPYSVIRYFIPFKFRNNLNQVSLVANGTSTMTSQRSFREDKSWLPLISIVFPCGVLGMVL